MGCGGQPHLHSTLHGYGMWQQVGWWWFPWGPAQGPGGMRAAATSNSAARNSSTQLSGSNIQLHATYPWGANSGHIVS